MRDLVEWGQSIERVDKRQVGTQAGRLVGIFDLSGSMAAQDAGEFGNRRRVDVLKDALQQLRQSFPGQIVAIGFNNEPFPLSGGARLEPTGCTALYKALSSVSHQALAISNVVLVSDGQPTDGKQSEALALVRGWHQRGVKFSVVYCGPEGGPGERFLGQLAASGGGTYGHCEVRVEELVQALTTALLEGPGGGIQLPGRIDDRNDV